jgi:hypothetical protein
LALSIEGFWREGSSILANQAAHSNPQNAFARWTHVWRRTLELLHDSFAGPTPADEQDDPDEDCIVGRYVYVTSPLWGKCKIFYEQSGEGTQDIVFLHTAGSDSRQYHGFVVLHARIVWEFRGLLTRYSVMNDPRAREKLRMTAFDLPAHGRSFPVKPT